MTNGFTSVELVKIFIPGVPQAKARPRLRIVKGKGGQAFASAYTPAKTRTYEGIIATAGAAAMNGLPPLSGPLRLEFTAILPVPASWPAWKRAAALRCEVYPTTKPDLDNVFKSLGDGLNAVAWKDDVQVVEVVARKYYGEIPGITATVLQLDGQAAQTARKAAA